MRNVSRNMRGVGADIGRSVGEPMQLEIQEMADQAFDNVAEERITPGQPVPARARTARGSGQGSKSARMRG